MIKFTEIYDNPKEYDPVQERVVASYGIREVFLNPRYIIFIKENLSLHDESQRKELVKGLNRDLLFTEISLATPGNSPRRINVIGTPEHILEKINEANG